MSESLPRRSEDSAHSLNSSSDDEYTARNPDSTTSTEELCDKRTESAPRSVNLERREPTSAKYAPDKAPPSVPTESSEVMSDLLVEVMQLEQWKEQRDQLCQRKKRGKRAEGCRKARGLVRDCGRRRGVLKESLTDYWTP